MSRVEAVGCSSSAAPSPGPRSRSSSSLSAKEQKKKGPRVFSRMESRSYYDRMDEQGGAAAASSTVPAGVSSLVHQTDASGRQQAATAPRRPRQTRRFSWGQMFCCCAAAPPLPRGGRRPLLGKLSAANRNKKCLVLDLDETLVHSSFTAIPNPDFVIPVDMDGVVHQVYVLKRPGCDQFMEVVGRMYEIVVYTASLKKYANPLLDKLDIHNVIDWRLFREDCVYHAGCYVKDLSVLGRRLEWTMIVDNSPMSYCFQPQNAIPCSSFIDDPNDRELFELLPYLRDFASDAVKDVSQHTHRWRAFWETVKYP